MKIFTIGFTKTTAESFFERLKEAGVSKLVDVRLNNVSQLAGFTKRDDLRYFLNTIGGIDYEHRPELAPTKELLGKYKKGNARWAEYEIDFLELIQHRQIDTVLSPEQLNNCCLLCSENKPAYCHRRLVAEYLNTKWGDVEIIHL